jgi:hypothetical protein
MLARERGLSRERDRCLGSKCKFVKQCRIQPDFETIAVDKFDMIGQDFPACGDRCVECLDLQVEALNDAPGLHEVAAIHRSNFSTGPKSFDIRTKYPLIAIRIARVRQSWRQDGLSMARWWPAVSVVGWAFRATALYTALVTFEAETAMVIGRWDKSGIPSRHVTVGRSRAPHRLRKAGCHRGGGVRGCRSARSRRIFERIRTCWRSLPCAHRLRQRLNGNNQRRLRTGQDVSDAPR